MGSGIQGQYTDLPEPGPVQTSDVEEWRWGAKTNGLKMQSILHTFIKYLLCSAAVVCRELSRSQILISRSSSGFQKVIGS